MDGRTTAVILGAGSFAAGKLKEKLEEQGIKVVRGDYEEIPENSAYIFDFAGNEEEWSKLGKGQKLVLIGINKEKNYLEWKEKLEGSEINWRIVVADNVYGVGMGDDGFLGRAFWLAAKNKNLVLPSLTKSYRVLAVDDLVEAILRACFFSGTMGKILTVGGKEVNSKMVAEVLVDEAKMTRTRVLQDDEVTFSEVDDALVMETGELLRWKAEIPFKVGAKSVVQYFVARIDEENRKKSAKVSVFVEKKVEREKVNKRYEVEIEEMEDVEEVEEEENIVEAELPEEVEEEKEVEISDEGEIEEIEEVEEEIEKVEEFKLERLSNSPLPERGVNKKVADKNEVEVKVEKEVKEDESEKKELERHEGKKQKIRWNNWGKLLFWLIGWVSMVVFLVNVIKMATIPKKIALIQEEINNGEYEKARGEIDILAKNNDYWLSVFDEGKVGEVLRIEREALGLLGLGLDLSQSGEKVAAHVFGSSEIEMATEIDKMGKELDEAISKMGILQGRLSGIERWLPGRFKEKVDNESQKLADKRKDAEKARKVVSILPELLGLDGKRREYMILLQNENEIRPTGGFIGSYGMLTLEDGVWLNFEVSDVYEADGQLKGHVEPPAEIKKYLGEAAWYMRDANWQASFPVAAKDIQWFLEKETGRKVDGVVGLNLASVKSILSVSGEIFVPDFNEKINENNLYEQAEFYSENKFFPGSVQKASFLGAVSKQLLEEIKSLKGAKGQEFLTAMTDSLEKNEIQVVLNEAEAGAVVAEAGWDGAMYDGKCNGDKCVADYLYIVEANLGVNKANYFLYRNIERQVEIEDKQVKNILKINYENTAKTDAWPGGDYKNYLRIYVPLEARVGEISWSENGGGEKKIVSGEDLKISQVGGKNEIGFLVKVPIGKKIGVEVNYSQAIDLSNLEKFSYLNYIQKQSGFGDTGIVTLVSVPTDWQILGVSPVANVVGGKLLFNQKLEKDIRMGVEMGR